MLLHSSWRSVSRTLPRVVEMKQGKIVEGVFAINKPTGISSAQALRVLQTHFDPSDLFAPWLQREKSSRYKESHNQQRRRKQKEIHVKIGHGGTLDPLATGVLIAGIGKGTKNLTDFLECTKTYETVILFGASTDTYDRLGKILKRGPYQHITREMVEKALDSFRGKFMQLPPLYSALKMNGKPLYEYAREGKPIPREIERRPVDVQEMELLEWMEGGTHTHKLPVEEAGKPEMELAEKVWDLEKETETKIEESSNDDFATKKRKLEEAQDDLVTERPLSKRRVSLSETDAQMSGGLRATADSKDTQNDKGPPAARVRMTVTSGFYVRSLCHDLGDALGSQALMAELVRTRQGQFELGKNVLDFSKLDKGEDVWGPQVEAYLDSWSQEYKPFASSNPDGNANTEKKVEVKAEEKPQEKSELCEVASAEV